MKKTILALAMMTMISAGAAAQGSDRQGRRSIDRTELVKKRTDAMVKKYGLNEEQASKLLELNKKYDGTMGHRMAQRPGARPGGMRPRPAGADSLKARTAPRKPAKVGKAASGRSRMTESAAQYEKELEAIMTPDQYAAYKAEREKRMAALGKDKRQFFNDNKAVKADNLRVKQ